MGSSLSYLGLLPTIILAILIFAAGSVYSTWKTCESKALQAYLKCEIFWRFDTDGYKNLEIAAKKAGRLLRSANYWRWVYNSNLFILRLLITIIFLVFISSFILILWTIYPPSILVVIIVDILLLRSALFYYKKYKEIRLRGELFPKGSDDVSIRKDEYETGWIYHTVKNKFLYPTLEDRSKRLEENLQAEGPLFQCYHTNKNKRDHF